MADNSPGDKKTRRRSSRRRSSFSERVGFFEQIWKAARSRSRSRESARQSTTAKTATTLAATTTTTTESLATSTTTTTSRTSRVELAYHGPRSDARDRSSEDPRRHRIPRASLSPARSPLTVLSMGAEGGGGSDPDWEEGEEEEEEGELRRRLRRRQQRSYSRERRRASSRSGDGGGAGDRSKERSEPRSLTHGRSSGGVGSGRLPPPYSPTGTSAIVGDSMRRDVRSTSPLKRTKSGRIVDNSGAAHHSQPSAAAKPRALSFRVSPAKVDPASGDDTTDNRVESPTVASSWTGPHKVQKLAEGHLVAAGTTEQQQPQDRAVSLPPPLPDRRRGGARQSEPALYPSMPRVEMMTFEVQRQERHQVKFQTQVFRKFSDPSMPKVTVHV